jgi:uncharacterized protein YaiE (UPF0345 family)
MKSLTSLIAASTVIASLVLTGCTSGPASTNANEIDKSAAGVMGVRACITNSSEKPVKIFFWEADSNDALPDNILRPGQTTCGEGTSYFSYWDLSFAIRFRDNTNKSLFIKNQTIGWPLVSDDVEFETAKQACGFSMKGPMSQDIGIMVPCSDTFRAGETRGYISNDVIAHQVNVTRLEDSGWKEFQIHVIR